jgi:type VI secretion system secreted protein Hcp
VQDLTVTKYVDRSSPNLMLSCCNGKHYGSALLTVRKAGGKPIEYIKIKLEEVMITGVTTGGSQNQDLQTENLILNFAKVSIDYTPQNADGSPGTAIPFGWDIAANSKE